MVEVSDHKTQVFSSDNVRGRFDAGIRAIEQLGFQGKVVLIDPKDLQHGTDGSVSRETVLKMFEEAVPQDDSIMDVIRRGIDQNVFSDEQNSPMLSKMLEFRLQKTLLLNFPEFYEGDGVIVISVGQDRSVEQFFQQAMNLKDDTLSVHLHGRDQDQRAQALLHEFGHGIKEFQEIKNDRLHGVTDFLEHEGEADAYSFEARRVLVEAGQAPFSKEYARDLLSLRAYSAVANEEASYRGIGQQAAHATSILFGNDPDQIDDADLSQLDFTTDQARAAHASLHDKINIQIGRSYAAEAIRFYRDESLIRDRKMKLPSAA
ncbi:MAG: hypothetical protein KDJ50_08420 [Alphaproteobacteria bacterium]|nr:hypothetical protein [Alphaproteobacteria bacterium]